jgi:hypothetical protein
MPRLDQVVTLLGPSLEIKRQLAHRLGADPATLALDSMHSFGDVVRASTALL